MSEAALLNEVNSEDSLNSAELGLWIFIISEGFFFAALFVAFMVYTKTYPDAFERASSHLSLTLGSLNTFVLLSSSFTMALAAKYSTTKKYFKVFAGLTLLLALLFLGIKAVEYHREFSEALFPGAAFQSGETKAFEMFFILYFLMTGFHALHIIGGAIAISWASLKTVKDPQPSHRVELCALYWHFVDVIWVFIFPLLYLTGRGK